MIFLWDDFNRQHAVKHGVSKEDAEHVVINAAAPYPRQREDDKLLVWGPDRAGRIIEVVFALKTTDQIPFDSINPADVADISEGEIVSAAYIIHAMPLQGRRLKQYRAGG